MRGQKGTVDFAIIILTSASSQGIHNMLKPRRSGVRRNNVNSKFTYKSPKANGLTNAFVVAPVTSGMIPTTDVEQKSSQFIGGESGEWMQSVMLYDSFQLTSMNQ